jgi:thiol-disulfide isomerase/thioredoxin
MKLLMSLIAGLALLAPLRAAPLVDVDGLRGQVVYLDFWASWCAPCRLSFPWLQHLQESYGAQGLTIIAVNVDTDRAAVEKFLARLRPTFDVRFDPQGKLPEIYKVRGMPSSVLIDRRGVTRFTHIGFRPIDAEAYESQVRELLDEK